MDVQGRTAIVSRGRRSSVAVAGWQHQLAYAGESVAKRDRALLTLLRATFPWRGSGPDPVEEILASSADLRAVQSIAEHVGYDVPATSFYDRLMSRRYR